MKKYEMINIKDRSPVWRPVLFRYDIYSNYKGETKIKAENQSSNKKKAKTNGKTKRYKAKK